MPSCSDDLQAGGEMGVLGREFDWSKTPLGPIQAWPASLRTTASTLLHSRQPMFLWWGSELIQLYNDAYRPQIDAVMSRAGSSWQIGPTGPAASSGSWARGNDQPTRRILIVEDNEDAAWILAETLAFIGHDVRCAHDGRSALRTAIEYTPEIVLLDIGLPVMNGYELAARLRSEPRVAGIQLIALTGYGQPDDRQRSADAGFVAHLVKPVSIDVLVETIGVVR